MNANIYGTSLLTKIQNQVIPSSKTQASVIPFFFSTTKNQCGSKSIKNNVKLSTRNDKK